MSRVSCMEFLVTLRDDVARRTLYSHRNLPQLLFHAKNDGFAFTASELADVAGALEASVILKKDQDPFDGTSRLWRHMWGRTHIDYLVTQVLSRHTDDELRGLVSDEDGAQ
jgi:hypothetical protein